MPRRSAGTALDELIAQIDFDTEPYYNLAAQSAASDRPDLASEAWANLSSITADLGKVRGELYRLSRGVEQLRLPAIEAVGLDQVAEQLRGLEVRLRPLGTLLSRTEEDGRIKRLLTDMLAVVDALDRVFELLERQPEAAGEGLLRGLRSVYELLQQGVARAGLTQMEVGAEFDPHRHLAMGTEPNAARPDGAVSRVLLSGYEWNGQVFRTAQVVVVRNAGAANVSD